MKLRNKLLMPLMGVITTAATIAPVATSCGENPNGVCGKITIKEVEMVDVTMTSSKESYTNKEAKEGFSITFTVDYEGTYTTPVFVLDKIIAGGTEIDTSKYTVEYSEDYGIFGDSFTVTFGAGAVKGDLEFDLRFDDDFNEIPVDSINGDGAAVPYTVSCDPIAVDFTSWDGKLSITTQSEDQGIKITKVNILYSDDTDETLNMDAHTLLNPQEYEDIIATSVKTWSIKFTDLGLARVAVMALSYTYLKIQLVWSETSN